MQKNTETSSYFPELTGVRAVAAFMVYLHHYNPFKELPEFAFVYNFVNEFHVGVTVFFVLSGFLIGYRYINTFSFTKAWFIKYVQNRVARIYPVYAALTILTFVGGFYTGLYSGTSGFVTFLLNITFLRGFFDSFKFTGIAQGWSLTVEECFYFSAPVIFYLYYKYKSFYLQPVLITIMGLGLVFVFHRFNCYGFFGTYKFLFLYTFLGRSLEFFVGIKLALILQKRKEAATVNSSRSFITLVALVGIISCLCALACVKGDYTFGVETPIGILINNVVLPIFIALLFYAVITENTVVAKILRTDIAVLLGKSSYVFYLIHLGVFHFLVGTLLQNFNAGIFKYCVTFVLLNIIAICIFKLFEEPLNKYLRGTVFSNTKQQA